MRFKPLFAAAVLALGASPAMAQYEIDWYTIDGGGGRSTGGVYSLEGTIGQPDAEVVSLCSADGGLGCVNPTYELIGGFWAGVGSFAGHPTCSGNLECLFRDGFEILVVP